MKSVTHIGNSLPKYSYPEYQKKYREEHIEALCLYRKKYGEKNKVRKAIFDKQYKTINKDKILKKEKIRYKKNREYILNRVKQYYWKNKSHIQLYKQEYSIKNRKSINKFKLEWQTNKIRTDPLFKLKVILRRRLLHIIKSRNLKKKYRFDEYIGCTPLFLKQYIQKQFVPGMTWENHGKWHIDHIVPLSSAQNEIEIYKLCHYKNLQPLWAVDNLKKGNKIIQ